ncbi:protease inhibitor 3-like [Drosophila elegans]|uniref:protease inhibitor 3-like n=1 Tax=Drosophila elegans TaxID=30023 RepID=UPI0007E6ACD9|nr:protease inhibitor 3-like [Drosophila elegans]
MKFILILSCLVLYVALTFAQSCPGRPQPQNCWGGKDEGVRYLHGCIRDPNDEMWYYNHHSNQCIKMQYRGCGGNHNRYCSLVSCQRACVRRT